MGAPLIRKYKVERVDGDPNGTHADCVYFVLDLQHDRHAIPALKAYVKSCRKDNPELAEDLQEVIERVPLRCGCREAFCPHTPIFGPTDHNEMAAYLIDANERLKK